MTLGKVAKKAENAWKRNYFKRQIWQILKCKKNGVVLAPFKLAAILAVQAGKFWVAFLRQK